MTINNDNSPSYDNRLYNELLHVTHDSEEKAETPGTQDCILEPMDNDQTLLQQTSQEGDKAIQQQQEQHQLENNTQNMNEIMQMALNTDALAQHIDYKHITNDLDEDLAELQAYLDEAICKEESLKWGHHHIKGPGYNDYARPNTGCSARDTNNTRTTPNTESNPIYRR